jgi:hypothetical protein
MWKMILSEDARTWSRINENVTMSRGEPVRSDYRPHYEGYKDEWPEERNRYMQTVFVPTLSCPLRSRIGEVADGGKWVCGLDSIARQARVQGCLVYSLGSNNQFGFEAELLARTNFDCEVHVFDHTVTTWKVPPEASRVHTHGLAVVSEATAATRGKPYMAYNKIRAMLGHANRVLTILKLDIERGEFEVLDEVLRHRDNLPDQILVEIHLSPSRSSSICATDELLFRLRRASYRLFHMEPNFFASHCCSEFAFLRVSDSR